MRVSQVPPALDRAAGWAWRLLVVGAFIAALLWLLWSVRVIVLPSLVALTLAPALTPLVALLRARGIDRPAPGIALLVALATVAGLIAIVAVSVVAQWDDLVDSVKSGVRDAVDLLERTPVDETEVPVGQETDRLSEWIDGLLGDPTATAAQGARTGIAVLTGLVLAVAVLYFVLRDGRVFWTWILQRFRPESRIQLSRAGEEAWGNLGGFVRGAALIALVDAVLIGTGLAVLDVPLAFPLAVLVFLGGFVPFVGATVSGLAAVLVAFASGGLGVAGVVLLLILLVQFVEGNFLQPIVQSRTVNLHPAVILLSVAAGGSLFGVLGAYLAVPVTAVAFTMVAALSGDGQ